MEASFFRNLTNIAARKENSSTVLLFCSPYLEAVIRATNNHNIYKKNVNFVISSCYKIGIVDSSTILRNAETHSAITWK